MNAALAVQFTEHGISNSQIYGQLRIIQQEHMCFDILIIYDQTMLVRDVDTNNKVKGKWVISCF